MGKPYSTIGKLNYSNYQDVFEKYRLKDIKKIRGNIEYKTFNSKNITDFYLLEQLCCTEPDELEELCKNRNIKIEGDKMLEQIILDYQIKNISKKWGRCTTFKETYDNYKGMGYQDINNLLRKIRLPYNFYPLIGGDNFNISILHCIYQLDNFLKKDGISGSNDEYVYRGIKPPQLAVIKSSMENDKKVRKFGEIYFHEALPDNAFISATKSIKIALRFVKQDPEYNCCILRFKIPKEIKYLNIDTSNEKEIIIQRDVIFDQFEIYKYYKKEDIYIIDCRIEPRNFDIRTFYKDNSILDKLKLI